MIKHIAGLILFSFIVGTSAVVAGFFYTTPSKVKSYSYGYERNHCKKKKRKRLRKPRHPRRVFANATPKISNAVYDKKSGLFTATLTNRLYDSRTRALKKIGYVFFVKDDIGARYVGWTSAQGANISTSSVGALSRLQDYELNGNLYVMPVEAPGRVLSVPNFNPRIATPVLVKK